MNDAGRRPWNTGEVRRAVALQALGYSHRRIAVILDRHPRGVLRYLTRYGVSPALLAAENRGRATSERQRAFCAGLGWPEVSIPTHARILVLLSEGPQTHRQIAAHLGWTLFKGASPNLRMRLSQLRHLRYVELTRTRPPYYSVAAWLLARKGDR